MPTEDRIEATAVDLTEKFDRLGYTVEALEGPQESADGDDGTQYYLLVSGDRGNVYVEFSTATTVAELVYPFDIARSLGTRLTDEEVAVLSGDTQAPRSEKERSDVERAGYSLAETVAEGTARETRFGLSRHASSPLVAYDAVETDTGFPVKFWSRCRLLPHENGSSVETLDTRTEMVLSAGERGRRYLRDAVRIDTADDPDDYRLTVEF